MTLKSSDVVCYLENFAINIINKQIKHLIAIINLYHSLELKVGIILI